MATLHVFDIQMERIAPYTPDASYAFNSYVYDDSRGEHGTHDPRVSKHGLDQVGVLKEYGSCPESSFRTNFDSGFRPVPPDSAFAHARKYRVSAFKAHVRAKSIEELKKLLVTKGPLTFSHIPKNDDGSLASDGHVVALIGYNDATKMIKYINSAAAPYNGIQERPYSYFLDRLQNLQGDQGLCWLAVTPSATADRFTARVRISHAVGRRNLVVRIGVEGNTPVTVWHRNCSVNMFDDTNDLAIDVALPNYASEYWPPQPGQWYVDVIDTSPPGSPAIAGHLDEVVLVERVFDRAGKCRPVLYRPIGSHFPIKRGKTLRVHIPRPRTTLRLSAERSSLMPGALVTLAAELTQQIWYSNAWKTVPVPNQVVEFQTVTTDPIEGTVTEAVLARKTTDTAGRCALSRRQIGGTTYRAVAVDEDTTVMAVSNLVQVSSIAIHPRDLEVTP